MIKENFSKNEIIIVVKVNWRCNESVKRSHKNLYKN